MRRSTGSVGRFGFVAIGAVWALTAITAPASAAQDDLDLVSRASGATGAKAEENADQAAISADGRFVAFRSPANNLHDDDIDSTVDVYVRDLQDNTTTLVSRAAGATGTPGNNTSDQPAISADGRFVAFTSTATNLHPDDTDGVDDVFVRDLQDNTTTLVSRAAGATGVKSDGQSRAPSISADGGSVAFRSTGANLHPDDTDGTPDMFVRGLQTNTTTLVSRATGATGAKGSGASANPAISADGSSVAFESGSTNLHPDDTDTTLDVFVRGLQTNTTTLVSRATGATGAKGSSSSDFPAISANGRFVAFHSASTNLHPDGSDATRDVFLRDLQADTTTLVSRAAGATGADGNDDSTTAAIAGDGQSVAFQSASTNLHAGDADTVFDVFVRDLQDNTTTLVSRATGPTGVKGNGNSFAAAISADGRFVAFASAATNLNPDDTDTQNDVFRRDLLGPTTPPEATCFGQPATITGTSGNDQIPGTTGVDVIAGLGGNDKITGLGGNDVICGGDGTDTIDAGGGHDKVDAGGGSSNTVDGGSGNDTLTGGTGADTLNGGSNDDTLDGAGGADRLSGGSDKDKLTGGTGSPDSCDGGSGTDSGGTGCESTKSIP